MSNEFDYTKLKQATSVDQSDREVPYNLRQSGPTKVEMLISTRVRKSPYWHLSMQAGCWRATIYNRVYHPRGYVKPEDGGAMVEYDAIVNHVTMWNVAVERQIRVKGPDAEKFTNYVITRDATKISPMRARYVILCNAYGGVLNDPILLRISKDEFWFSLSDSDIGMYLQGVNADGRFNCDIEEIDVCPVQIQGPKSKALMKDLCGDQVDFDNNIWIAIVDTDMLLMYNQNSKEFEQFLRLPTSESGPSALLLDDNGNMWFAEALSGRIGVVDSKTFEITEFAPDTPLDEPFALLFDKSGSLWIAEHIGPGITKFDPILETFYQVKAPNPESLPFGMAIDKYDNIWFGQHVIDELGVYDPYNDQLIEVSIPTPESFTQFITADDKGDIWFVEQRTKKLGVVSISSVPGQARAITDDGSGPSFNYAEIVSPLIAGGIVVSSLFFVKSVNDKRRIDKMLSK